MRYAGDRNRWTIPPWSPEGPDPLRVVRAFSMPGRAIGGENGYTNSVPSTPREGLMGWAQFGTIIAQVFIAALVLFVLSAGVAAVMESWRGRGND